LRRAPVVIRDSAACDPGEPGAERPTGVVLALVAGAAPRELGAERIVAGTPDLLALGSYMGTPILTPQAFLEQASPAR